MKVVVAAMFYDTPLCWTIYAHSCIQRFELMLGSFQLVRNQDVLEQLQSEISVIANQGNITQEQIQGLPFLQCCLNESLS